MRTIALAALAIMLAGCDDQRPAQLTRIQSGLPKGCLIRDLGSYGRLDAIMVVVCDGRQTTTTTMWDEYQCGKARCQHAASAVIIAE